MFFKVVVPFCTPSSGGESHSGGCVVVLVLCVCVCFFLSSFASLEEDRTII